MLPEHTQSGFEADSWGWFAQQLPQETDPIQRDQDLIHSPDQQRQRNDFPGPERYKG